MSMLDPFAPIYKRANIEEYNLNIEGYDAKTNTKWIG